MKKVTAALVIVSLIVLAGCGGGILDDQSITISGQVLSIYEASDALSSSCERLFERSSPGSTFQEIRLDTSLGHGEFYTPRSEWVDPTLKWALGED